MLRLQPSYAPGKKLLKNVCPICERVISEGTFFLVLMEDSTPKGIIPEGEQECCGKKGDGPKLYTTLAEAERGAQMLASNRLDFELLPIDSIVL